MQLAEATVYPDDHVWATEIQERVVARQQRQQLSYRTATVEDSEDEDDGPGLYRWEESIEEWVARTPVSKTKTKSVGLAQTSLDSGSPSSSVRSPSVSASSMSSDEDPASSVTSATSLPVKRTFPGRQGLASRSPKRLRSMTWRSRDDQIKQSPAVPVPIPPTPATSDDDSDSDSDDWQEEYGSSSACRPRRLGVLDEWMQERPLRRMRASDGGQSVGLQQMLEVVITHKRIRSPNSGRTGNSSPVGTTIIPRTRAMIPMVPWSPEDDSDDELSFL